MTAPYQLVTLVTEGGVPAQLVDQFGAPFATTGTGALVFANAPTLYTPIIIGGVTIDELTVTGNVAIGGTLDVSGLSTLDAVSIVNDLAIGGTITSGTWNGSTIGVPYGGTGLTSYAVGDILYASGTTTLSKLPIGTNGQVLTISGGLPVWADDLSGVTSFSAGTTGLTPSTPTGGAVVLGGTLNIASGGTNGSAAPTAGAVAYGTGTAYGFTLAGTAGQFLQSNGATTPTWTQFTSVAGAPAFFGNFYDNDGDQTAASTTVAYPIRINSVVDSNGVTITGAGSTRITFANAGTYLIGPSIQFVNSNTSIQTVHVWFRKDGTDIPASDSYFDVPNKHGGANGNLIAALSFMATVAAGNYIELYWSTTSTDVYIHTYPAGVSPVSPQSPGVIVTVASLPQIGLGYAGLTSTTSTTIGTGSKTFTTNLTDQQDAYVVGSRVRVASSASPSNFMEGVVTAYSGTSLTVNVDSTGGSGTYASWNFSIAGIQGNAGLTIGTTTVSGGTSGRVLYDNAGVVGELTTTGSGSVVLDTNAILTTPNLGTPSAINLTNATSVPVNQATGTLAIANGGTGQTTAGAAFNALSPITSVGDLIIGNGANSATRLPIGTNAYVLTSNGTTASWQPVPGASLTVGTSVISGGTTTRVLYDNAGVLGEYAITGSGNVAMSHSPTFTGTVAAADINMSGTLNLNTAGVASANMGMWNGGGTTLSMKGGSGGFALLNNASSANNLVIDDSGNTTLRSGSTLAGYTLTFTTADTAVSGRFAAASGIMRMWGYYAGATTIDAAAPGEASYGPMRIVGNPLYLSGNGVDVVTVTSTLLTSSIALRYGGVTLNNAVTGTGNMVLSDNPTVTGILTLSGDSAGGYSNWSLLQQQIKGSTDSNKRLAIGFDTTNNLGVIQAGVNGTGWSPLWLNPAGGKVYAVDTLGLRRPAGDYGIDMVTNASTGNTSISTVGSGATLTINSPIFTSPALGTVASGNIAACTGWPGGNYAYTLQVGNIAFGGWTNLVNTGTLGGSGQVWYVLGLAQITDSASTNSSLGVRLYDSASGGIMGQAYVHTSFVNSNVMVPVSAAITLTSSSTFYLQATNLSTATGLSYGGLTCIIAFRLA